MRYIDGAIQVRVCERERGCRARPLSLRPLSVQLRGAHHQQPCHNPFTTTLDLPIDKYKYKYQDKYEYKYKDKLGLSLAKFSNLFFKFGVGLVFAVKDWLRDAFKKKKKTEK